MHQAVEADSLRHLEIPINRTSEGLLHGFLANGSSGPVGRSLNAVLLSYPSSGGYGGFPCCKLASHCWTSDWCGRRGSRLPSKAGLLSIFRRHQCLLICGRCGNALATVRVGHISLVRVQHVTGHDVAPLQGDVAERVAAARVSAAEAAAQQAGRRPEDDLEVLAARDEVEYLRRQVGEIAFDLQCPSCESRYWRSLPHLVKEIRSAPADQVRVT
jgi:hypothetical protein